MDEQNKDTEQVTLADTVDIVETEPTTTPRKITKRTAGIAGIAVAAVVLIGAGVAWATVGQASPEVPVVSSKEQTSTQVSNKAETKSTVKLTLKAEGADAGATKAKVVVIDDKGKSALAEAEVKANEQVTIGKLTPGTYELYVSVAPVAEDGSTYKLPESAQKFEVGDKGEDVVLECTLAKLAKEDMSKEQLEAVASVLAGAGKAEAAEGAKQAAQGAPSVPGSAGSIQQPSAPTGGTSGGSTPSNPGSTGGGSTTPSQPEHQHAYTTPVYGQGAPIYGQGAPIYGQGAPIYSQQAIYGDKCNYCGANITGNAWAHFEQYQSSDPMHAIASSSGDVVVGYEQVITGYEQVITGYEQVVTGYEQVVTGHKCSCGSVA